MIREALASRIYYRVCCFVLFFVAASASFNGYYDKWHFHEAGVSGANSLAQFDLMVDGTAHRPYIFRQLLPATANWLDRVAPQTLKVWLYNPDGDGPSGILDFLFDSPLARSQTYFFRYMVVYACTFLFALLAVYAMHLVCRATQVSTPAAVFAPVIVILLFPYFLSVGGYFYDYPELAFMALAVWIALKFDWWWIIPLAALGTWNKESFLLVIPTLYPILRRRSSRLSALVGTGVLCLVCAAVYFSIRVRFAHNAGDTLELHWNEQLLYFEHPLDFFVGLEKTYGLLVSKCCTLLPLAFVIWTAWRGWRHLPRAIQRHGQIAAAINIPLFLLFCYPGELRDLSMLYIVFLLLVAGNLNQWVFAWTRTTASPANRRVVEEGPDGSNNLPLKTEAPLVSGFVGACYQTNPHPNRHSECNKKRLTLELLSILRSLLPMRWTAIMVLLLAALATTIANGSPVPARTYKKAATAAAFQSSHKKMHRTMPRKIGRASGIKIRRELARRQMADANPHMASHVHPSQSHKAGETGAARRRARQKAISLERGRRGQAVMPSPLRGSYDSLARQNERVEADGLERIEDDGDLADRIAHKMLVPVPASGALSVNGNLAGNRRYCRPWTARFLSDLSRLHQALFHRPLEVSSAVRTVEYQKRLMGTNGNAAAAEGDIVSPHLTGATIDIVKQGLSRDELGWMRHWLLLLQQDRKIDVEEEFQQSCFHITVYRSYMPPQPARAAGQRKAGNVDAGPRKAGPKKMETPTATPPTESVAQGE